MTKEESGAGDRSIELNTTQIAKLRSLDEPGRWIDETFSATAIGVVFLKAGLILVNPEKDPHKAYILTALGKQILRATKPPRAASKNPVA